MLTKKIPPLAQQYIYLDHDGKILETNFKEPDKIVGILQRCLNGSLKVAPERCEFLRIKFKTGTDVFVFPVGKRVLGVIKKEEIPVSDFEHAIKKIILGKPEPA